MSGIHYRYAFLRWPLEGSEYVEPGNPYAKAPSCVMADLQRRGWAYPPCVYTDDPVYDDAGDCLKNGCSYKFLDMLLKIEDVE